VDEGVEVGVEEGRVDDGVVFAVGEVELGVDVDVDVGLALTGRSMWSLGLAGMSV
jgi:hypothetical protein